jgi:membrane protein required for colicin V production
MTALDYFVVIVVAASVALGATRGIIKGIISVISAIAGLLAAAHFYEQGAWLAGWFVERGRARDLLGFVMIFLLVMVAGSFAARGLGKRLRRGGLNWVDRFLGAGVGLVRGWLVCSALYLALTAFPVKLEAVERARFAPALLEGTRVIAYLASSEMRQQFFEGYTKIKRLWEQEA